MWYLRSHNFLFILFLGFKETDGSSLKGFPPKPPRHLEFPQLDTNVIVNVFAKFSSFANNAIL
jgi:hypothetical protein